MVDSNIIVRRCKAFLWILLCVLVTFGVLNGLYFALKLF